MSSRTRKVLMIVGGVLLLCCLCMVVIAVIPIDEERFAERRTATSVARLATAEYTPPSSTPTTTHTPVPPSATLPPTDIPTNTNTPLPTNTPTVTNTPKPTSTPKPTNTPEPTTDPAEVEYIVAITSISDDYQFALQRISDLSIEASENTSLFFDENWKLDMTIALAILLVEEEALQELDPPAKFAQVHEVYLEAAAHFSEVARLMDYGINNLDVTSIEQASIEMVAGSEKIQEATELLEDIQD